MPLKIAVFCLILFAAPAEAHHYHHYHYGYNPFDVMMQNLIERDRLEHRKYLLSNFNRHQLRRYDICRLWSSSFRSYGDCTTFLY